MRERLIELRKKYFQMSQREFCKKLGITQSTYAPLESGRREIRAAYIKLICQVYSVNEDWFRNGVGEMFKDSQDEGLVELLSVYDNLSPLLKTHLVKQAKGIQDLQNEI